jgi:hypothetical protein
MGIQDNELSGFNVYFPIADIHPARGSLKLEIKFK